MYQQKMFNNKIDNKQVVKIFLLPKILNKKKVFKNQVKKCDRNA